MVDTIIKWAGGKKQILEKIISHFPKIRNNYHEPMIGGGAVFFSLEPKSGTINDINSRLINFYRKVRDSPKELIKFCDSLKDPESKPDPNKEFANINRKGKKIKNFYYQQREIFNRRPNNENFDLMEEAALFLYLNRTCYNGLYRENLSGEFNVPIGRYENPDWVREEQIINASKILKNVKIFNEHFNYVLEFAKPSDLVYFDPPYVPMSITANFTDYHSKGFNSENQKKLIEVAKKLDNKGVNVLISNSGIMYETYKNEGFYVDIIEARRAINSDPEKRGNVNEIIATNIPPEKQKGK
ncbi:MAG: DNA adenine methylase [Nanoarchaeota archaeon]